MDRRSYRTGLLLSVCAAVLTGCGGGGGGAPPSTMPPPITSPTPSPTPVPVPSPSPSPTPSPSPSPSGSFGPNDAEYSRSNAAVAAKAITAYQAGATGQGVKIAIVDSGINPALSEFAGRIDPASRTIRNGGPVTADSFHGTSVAAVAAAARNGSGMQGVAFSSTILAFNSANSSDCDEEDGCSHGDNDIAQGIDLARTNGARVINISLGGSDPAPVLLDAVRRATQAGIVIVFSAGNEGDANADPFGLGAAQQAGNGLVVIAGALGLSGDIADFSNRAGAGAPYYLMALGERVRAFDETGAAALFSGTSYSAPVISGAVALVASAFPNMSGAQIIDLLFRTADDLGAPGVDPTYGHGALNLQRAFQPQGSLSLAGGTAPIALYEGNQASAAMGDAGGGAQQLGAIILDGYSRAFVVDFAARLNRAARDRPLAQALRGDVRTAGADNGPVSVSLTVSRDVGGQPQLGLAQTGLGYEDARKVRALAGYALGRVTPKLAVAFGLSESGQSLQQRLAGREGAAFLVARDPMSRNGFVSNAGSSIAVRQQLGRIGLIASSESGRVWSDGDPRLQRPGYAVAGLAADTRLGPALLSFGASRMKEDMTVLGGRFSSAFTSGGAASWFVDGSADFDLGRGWLASASYRRGWTSIPGTGALVTDGRLGSEAWSLDLARAWAGGNRLAFRVTQPLRVASGGLNLAVPVSYDYRSGSVGYEQGFFNLAPTGREIDFETAYGTAFGGGWLSLNAFLRRQPGHIAEADADLGSAIRFSLGF